MSYQDLSEIDKIEQAIEFVALGQPLPDVLEAFLVASGLYDQIVNPGILESTTYEDNGGIRPSR